MISHLDYTKPANGSNVQRLFRRPVERRHTHLQVAHCTAIVHGSRKGIAHTPRARPGLQDALVARGEARGASVSYSTVVSRHGR